LPRSFWFAGSSADFLLVADGNQIIQVDSEAMDQRQMSINVTSQPQVLVYDWQRREVYWTSAVNTSSIFKYSFVDEKTTVVYVEPTSTITVVIDVVVQLYAKWAA